MTEKLLRRFEFGGRDIPIHWISTWLYLGHFTLYFLPSLELHRNDDEYYLIASWLCWRFSVGVEGP